MMLITTNNSTNVNARFEHVMIFSPNLALRLFACGEGKT